MGDEHTSLARGCHDLRPNLGTVKNAEKLYRVGFNAVRHNEDLPEGESPAEVWRRLVTLVRGSP